MPKGIYTTPEIMHDEPLSEGENFEFHFDDFAATLARLIASKETKTPLAICVSGAWGAGKTSLLKRIRTMLKKTSTLRNNEPELLEFANGDESPRQKYRYCRTVWFNAWKYSDEEELLVALIRVLVQNMSEDTLVNKAMAKLLDPSYPRRDVLNTVLSWFKVNLSGVEVKLNTGEEIPTRLSEKTAILDLFDDTFDRLMAVWIHRRLNAKKINPEKGVLVIFIDDLDRCLPVKMVQVLEAIKLFMDKRGCVFVLGADSAIIQQAVVKHYEDSGVTGENAKEYLDKIVQLRFDLPPIVETAMQNYLTREAIVEDDWGDSWKLLITGANVNPRTVKSFVNDVNLQWSMLVNSGQAEGVNRADFSAWQVLMRAAPRNFILRVRVVLFNLSARHKFILDAVKWAKEEPEELQDKFREFTNDVRLKRVLQEISFSDEFTPEALDSFIHLSALTSITPELERIEKGRKLRVFLVHAAQDKPKVRDLYQKLKRNGIDAWLDEEKLLPGEDWDLAIREAISNTDVILVCMSQSSVTKLGYVQKEIRFALDVSDQKPEGTIFIVPIRFESCEIPERLNRYQWVDLFGEKEDEGYKMILRALRIRADALGIEFSNKRMT